MAIKYGGNERGWSMKCLGVKELEKILTKDLPNQTARRVLLSSIRQSAKPMQAAAKQKVVKKSHALYESIGMKTIRNRGRNKEFASVALGPMSGNMQAWAMYMNYYKGDRSDDWAGRQIQSGAISSKRARKGRIRHGHLVEFGFTHTSGKRVPARPFLRPAFDQEANGFVRSFKDILKVKIETAAQKIYAKNKASVK